MLDALLQNNSIAVRFLNYFDGKLNDYDSNILLINVHHNANINTLNDAIIEMNGF